MYTEEAMKLLYSCYSKVVRVDLKSEDFILIKSEEVKVFNKLERHIISEYLERYIDEGLIHEYDVDEFRAKTDIHYVRDYFEVGNKCLVIHYRKIANKKYRWYSLNIIREDDYSPDNMMAYFYIKEMSEDYVANTEYMRELQYVNSHDTLTGLMNFYAYRAMLVEYNPDKKKKDVTAIFADINGLKYTNDTQGHTAGNKLICKFAEILLGIFLKEYIFRISGDEFVVLLFDLEEPLVTEFCDRLKQAIAAEKIPIASVGIWSEERVSNIENVVSKAEEKMYEEKEAFHKVYPYYSR